MIKRLKRLGVVEVERKISSTTTVVKSMELLTREKTLKILAGALGLFVSLIWIIILFHLP